MPAFAWASIRLSRQKHIAHSDPVLLASEIFLLLRTTSSNFFLRFSFCHYSTRLFKKEKFSSDTIRITAFVKPRKQFAITETPISGRSERNVERCRNSHMMNFLPAIENDRFRFHKDLQKSRESIPQTKNTPLARCHGVDACYVLTRP